MFWGLIMEANKRYTQVVDKPFHISHAAMDTATGDNEPCQVMVVVDNKNFLVCTLQKNKTVQMPLDLYFKTGENISFLTNGKCNIHLTGYVDPEFDDEDGEEEAEEEEEVEEEEKPVPTKNKRKLEAAKGDGTASKKLKAKKVAADDSSDSDESKDQLQKFLNGEELETDDNDETFNATTEDDSDDESGESDDEEEEEEEGEEEQEEASDDEMETSKADTTLDSSIDKSQIDMSKLSKAQKKRLKKKLQKQKQASSETQVNGVDKTKKDKKEPEQKKADSKKEAKEVPVSDKKEKKSLSGGVFIEDLKVGSGAVAKPGKTVMVYYEGKLKQNNKMFDSHQKGPGFKFRLGAKEVISGWDVGVAGMKVGGKRKIVCPPAMAYGAKGSPPVIPPNSTLVFEVELKNVK
ncbi:46 kDa FK506-binding nuclear protein isoform X2 [Leptidea sinapis]|uniref:46 kDa FK506-binding nuclear protein isoform X2 n=1 Tax=Leptidea sinapis TaxID=189913 RepID=UPI0021C2EF3D|nr:46 kDa FK506-binding nuclear protein isoform X2 [Leptidea sinapis]